MPPFHFPLPFNYYNRYNRQNIYNNTNPPNTSNNNSNYTNFANKQNDCVNTNSENNHQNVIFSKLDTSKDKAYEDYFFELFGLKLYYDDILLMCLLFFLYNEGVSDDELFISLILLLLS